MATITSAWVISRFNSKEKRKWDWNISVRDYLPFAVVSACLDLEKETQTKMSVLQTSAIWERRNSADDKLSHLAMVTGCVGKLSVVCVAFQICTSIYLSCRTVCNKEDTFKVKITLWDNKQVVTYTQNKTSGYIHTFFKRKNIYVCYIRIFRKAICTRCQNECKQV